LSRKFHQIVKPIEHGRKKGRMGIPRPGGDCVAPGKNSTKYIAETCPSFYLQFDTLVYNIQNLKKPKKTICSIIKSSGENVLPLTLTVKKLRLAADRWRY
jgi:hypothetical protein